MKDNAQPLDSIIEFAWASGADKFWVNNAKDELKKLRNQIESFKIVAYGLINDRNDLYDLRIQNNTQNDQTKVIPLYSNRKEFLSKDWVGYKYNRKSF